MDVRLTVRTGPGEQGVAETHTWTLKEAQTTTQVLDFVRSKVRPFIGMQTDMSIVSGPDDQESATSVPVPETRRKRRGKKAKVYRVDSTDEPREDEDSDDDGLSPEDIERKNQEDVEV